MSLITNFHNERDARIFRDSKRDEGYSASLFIYGKDRYRVKAIECADKEKQQEKQRWLSTQAWNLSTDIQDLTKIKELIASPDFGCEIEDVVLVARKLEEERWFTSSKAVIDFFDYPTDSVEKIKEMVDISLKEYDEEWDEYLNMQT